MMFLQHSLGKFVIVEPRQVQFLRALHADAKSEAERRRIAKQLKELGYKA